MNIKNIIKKFFSFGLIGILNTFIDFFIFFVLLKILPTKNDYMVTIYSAIGFIIANINSYYLNSKYTFNKKGNYYSFLIISLFSLILNSFALSGSLFVLKKIFQNKYMKILIFVSKILGTGISMISNFILYNYLCFKKGE